MNVVNIGGVYYNLALFQRIVLTMDAVELTDINWTGRILEITDSERINIASWLSHHEWRSPVCAANLTKRHTETPE